MNHSEETTRTDYIVWAVVIALLVVVNVALLATGRLPADWEGLGIMIAAGITIGMYSVLYKDNVPIQSGRAHFYRRVRRLHAVFAMA